MATVGVLIAGMLALPSLAQARPTYVSLTFDDATASQASAVSSMAAHGMRGTFYVNSGDVGSDPYFMTWPQIQAIAAAGHEIGGHTTTHADLTTLSPAMQTVEICGDRQACRRVAMTRCPSRPVRQARRDKPRDDAVLRLHVGARGGQRGLPAGLCAGRVAAATRSDAAAHGGGRDRHDLAGDAEGLHHQRRGERWRLGDPRLSHVLHGLRGPQLDDGRDLRRAAGLHPRSGCQRGVGQDRARGDGDTAGATAAERAAQRLARDRHHRLGP
jgi:Polysaccharide deacetylase